jgi:PAS domain S-box-containing protein
MPRQGQTKEDLRQELEVLRGRLAAAEAALAARAAQIQPESQAHQDLNVPLTDILENISDGFFALDHNLVFTYFNRAAEELLGHRRRDVLGRHLLDAFPEARGSIFEAKYTQALKKRKPLSFETHFETPPYINWYKVRVYPFAGSLSIFFRVTTAHKEAEQEIRRLASFPELNPNPVLEVDEEGQVIYANPVARRVAETLGALKGLRAFLPPNLKELFAAALQDGPRQHSFDLVLQDRVYAVILFFSHDLPTAHLYALDITERRRAEEEMQLALQEVKQRRKEAEALLRAARAVMTQHTFADAAWEIFERCREAIEAPAGYVSLLSDTGDYNELVFLESGGLPCTVDPELPMPIRGLRAEAYRTGEVVYDNDFAHSEYVKFLPDGHVALENVLFAPLVYEAKVVGLLGLSNKPGGFTTHDARLAAGFAYLAAVALVSRRAEEALRRLNEELEQRVEERASELSQTVEQLLWEVEERQQTEQALRESEEKLLTLTSQLLTRQEEERIRLSRELHDSLGQTLLVLKLQLRAIEKRLRPDQQTLRQESEQTLRLIDQIIEDVRRLARNLSPSVLEDIGLAAALRNLCEEFSRHQNLSLSLDMDDISGIFSPENQSHIYRIFQESLTNIGKYAKAIRVSLAIKRRDGGVAFVIKDDGIGFQMEEVQARGGVVRAMGLTTMAERVRMLGGKLDITSNRGGGTIISFIVPEASVS